MKRLAYIFLVIALFVFTACSKKEDSKNVDKVASRVTEPKTIECSLEKLSGEYVFKPVDMAGNALLLKAGEIRLLLDVKGGTAAAVIDAKEQKAPAEFKCVNGTAEFFIPSENERYKAHQFSDGHLVMEQYNKQVDIEMNFVPVVPK